MILSLDPGGTTGWAFDVGDMYTVGHIGPEVHHEELWRFLSTCLGKASEQMQELTIVCESFEYRMNDKMRDKIVLVSCEYIGIVKLFCNLTDTKLVMQSAATGKGFWSDDRLKRADAYQKGMRHANDAVRHLLHYRGFTLNDTTVFLPLKDTG